MEIKKSKNRKMFKIKLQIVKSKNQFMLKKYNKNQN